MKTTYRPHCKVKCLGKTLFEISLFGKVFVCVRLSTNHTHTLWWHFGVLMLADEIDFILAQYCDSFVKGTHKYIQRNHAVDCHSPTPTRHHSISPSFRLTFFSIHFGQNNTWTCQACQTFSNRRHAFSFLFSIAKLLLFGVLLHFPPSTLSSNSIRNARGAYLVFCL